MHKLNDEMRACIEACLNCHTACYGMAMSHCLETGGPTFLHSARKPSVLKA